MNNLADYFIAEQEYYLDAISYERIDRAINAPKIELNCADRIDVKTADDKVVVTVTRKLSFSPEALFSLSIKYGAVLCFDPEKKKDVDWGNVNLADEFISNGTFVTSNLLNRISLLIGEITGSFGQTPIIVPPQFLNRESAN